MASDIDRLRLAIAREAGEAAYALTIKAARRKTIPLLAIADEVTDLVEGRIDHLFTMSRLGTVACGADCAYCCYVPRVLVSLPELARIVERVQRWPADRIDALKKRLEAHVLAQSSEPAAPIERPPCAFLVDRRCSIYDARPLVCRAQHAYDAQQCKAQCETGSGNTTQLTVVLDAVQGAVSGVVSAFREMGVKGPFLDLSRALLLAIDNPRVIAMAANGLPALMSATVAETTDAARGPMRSA